MEHDAGHLPHVQAAVLPDLPSGWLRGHNAPSVHRGGDGSLSAQAQQIIGNVHAHVEKHRVAFAAMLKLRPHSTSARIVAMICGLPRRTVESRLREMQAQGWTCSQSLRFVAAGRHPSASVADGVVSADVRADALPDIGASRVVCLWGEDEGTELVDEIDVTMLTTPLAFASDVAAATAASSAALALEGGHVRSASATAVADAPAAPAMAAPATAAPATAAPATATLQHLGKDSRAFARACWKTSAQPRVTPLPSIHTMPSDMQHTLAALRVGTLVAKILAAGATLKDFEGWMHTLDALFPGEFGQINHSRHFANSFADSLLQTVEGCHMWELQRNLRALRMPSDFARTIDGITVSIGESLLIHVVIAMGRDGVVRWHLLDLTPQGVMAPSTARSEHDDARDDITDDATLDQLHRAGDGDAWRQNQDTNTAWTGFQSAGPTVDKCHQVEGRYSIFDLDRVHRFAVNVADGAVEGPHGKHIGFLSAQRSGIAVSMASSVSSSGSAVPAASLASSAATVGAARAGLEFPWGSTDQAHSIDNAGARADQVEKRPGGYVAAYMQGAQQVRHLFGMGKCRVIIRAVAKKYGLSWRRPLAPHSAQTRTMLYESKRVPPNLLRNVAAIVYALRFLLREAIEGSRRQSAAKRRKTVATCGVNTLLARQHRSLGRCILDPQMLLFLSMRYDHRRQASLQYAQLAQSVEISGLEKVVLQEETEVAMMLKIASIRAVRGIMHVAWILSRVVPKAELEAFVTLLVWGTATRHYPTLVPVLLEFVFKGSFRGVAPGHNKCGRHPFAEPAVTRNKWSSSQALQERLRLVSVALERMVVWALEERRQFQTGVMSLPAGGVPAALAAAAAPAVAASVSVACAGQPSDANISDIEEDDVASDAVSLDDGVASSGSASCETSESSLTPRPSTSPRCPASGAGEHRVDVVISRSGCHRLDDWRQLRRARWQTSDGIATVWDHRRQLLACATHVFHVSALLPRVGESDAATGGSAKQGLLALSKQFGPLLFGHAPDRCPYDAPPKEMHKCPTDEELWGQYLQLRQLVRDIRKNHPDRFDRVSEVVQWIVVDRAGRTKKVPARDVNAKSLRLVVSDGCEYEYVTSRKHGDLQVVARIRKHMDHKMHGLLMGLNYEQVSHLWHILRMYHRVMMWSMSSEAIAEHVGSLIRYIEKKHGAGGALDVPALVRATRLRAAGVRGDTSDGPLIMRAMSLHFRRQGGVRFFLARTRSKATSEEMWGPSSTISKIRARIVEDSEGPCPWHPWVGLATRMDLHACKRVRRSTDDARYLPDELPSHVWEAVAAYMVNLEHGTEETLRPQV